ncbi:imidazole glycerol phosphate synthase subunit HisH [Nitrospina watsonii]|uniref:Imidazole glycerol phosphate synthase subunit HisH n=1 Tax=Nitrospina watsonii TaxID=1323948 RepID=A0ABN8VTH5_9BACT|nr:imidazole glycerol phosphate synthase subunit HisH [Nitrospina watsonii]CAI2717003.1 Imidazole glycerol phosphate synthase subunit HisH [Nitrospina watsonii]
MKDPRVSIIDYGISNLLNVVRAFEHCGAKTQVAESPGDVVDAERLVLPGVGAFADGMNGLRTQNLVEPIKAFCKSGRPFLGICLGMQMMLESSEEFGHHSGLELIPGKVVPVPRVGIDGTPHKIPHIGWNELKLPPQRADWHNTILDTVEPGAPMYFIHSFMAAPINDGHRLADCLYDGQQLTAALNKDNLYGCQFHPEKSGEMGLGIVRKFLNL